MPTPPPPANLQIEETQWPQDQPIHRIHLDIYKADAFNPGAKGNARFSPIVSAQGQPIPTLYGGNTFECAAMESIFHDVPFVPGFKTQDKQKLHGQVHSILIPSTSLRLAALNSVSLRKLGLERKHLIDTEKDQYPETRLWAQAIHTQFPHVQGLCWVSRQDDTAFAIILFGDRIDRSVLSQQGTSDSILGNVSTFTSVLELAARIGVDLISARP
jgi:hypothetical protein